MNTSIREAVRVQAGRNAKASAMIIDSQSAKSAEGGEKIGFDGGKQVRGRKRTLITDTLGLVVLAKVASANTAEVHAGKEALLDLKSQPELLEQLKKIFADGGYRRNLITWVKDELNADLEIVLRLGEQKGFQVARRSPRKLRLTKSRYYTTAPPLTKRAICNLWSDTAQRSS